MAETLVILIYDINSLDNRLYQEYQHFRLCCFCVFCKGGYPFFCLFQVTNGNHAVFAVPIQLVLCRFNLFQFSGQFSNIFLNVRFYSYIHLLEILDLICNALINLFLFLARVVYSCEDWDFTITSSILIVRNS